jgi:glucose/arabinose dehydrogenase
MAFLPDGSILITERPGRLKLFSGGSLTAITHNLDIASGGQGGLLDIALHPQYSQNGWIYLSYSASDNAGRGTALARAKLQGNRLVNAETIFRMKPFSRRTQHFGSRIAFDKEGYLYLTIGDRGEMNRAQLLNDHAGSTIRLHNDGTIPADNPFYGKQNALPEIYSYGHRNAQAMILHPETGKIWQNEHGPKGGDEVNILKRGANYGWPEITYGIDYSGATISSLTHKEGMEQPIIHWTPSIAPSGMAFYNARVFPNWNNNIFVGALAGAHLRRLVLQGERIIHQEVLLHNQIGRIRDVRTGPDGYIYLLTDARNGGLYRLEPLNK